MQQNINLDHISTADLEAALAARQAAENARIGDHMQQAFRDHDARVKAARERVAQLRTAQDPTQWAQDMAHGGLPVASAMVMAEVLAVIFNRLTALETAQQPAHMRGVEKRA
jgi:hypothetical protein